MKTHEQGPHNHHDDQDHHHDHDEEAFEVHGAAGDAEPALGGCGVVLVWQGRGEETGVKSQGCPLSSLHRSDTPSHTLPGLGHQCHERGEEGRGDQRRLPGGGALDSNRLIDG